MRKITPQRAPPPLFLSLSHTTSILHPFRGPPTSGPRNSTLSWHLKRDSWQLIAPRYCILNPFDGDQGTVSKDLVQVPIGPVTRARAKKFKDVLNGLIQELWAQANSWKPIEHDPRGPQRMVTLIQVLEESGQG
ncbi:hypothetical protein CJ030_MR8G011194 [Morella rubra]|uniref:Uncharacterized protein n=1 Tax=Morella rubra TaxID=262757 RepID=A0A6A1UTD2_9ROSI|nr:hypothetical protein CJ030_MR8G011194 [Morella rubra]